MADGERPCQHWCNAKTEPCETEDEACEWLVEKMLVAARDPNKRTDDRLRAALWLLDRGWGR